MEDGTRSGAQEQEHLFQLNGKFNELQENEGEEKETRVNQPPVSEPHTKRPFLPFRSWCAECAAGRRDNPPHRRVPKDEYAEPEILMDYCLRKKSYSRSIYAWVVERQGADLNAADVAQRGLIELRSFGLRRRVHIQTDSSEASRCWGHSNRICLT